MTYLKKPRWIDGEDEDRPFPVQIKPTREELEMPEPVHFSGEDEYAEHAADMYHLLDDFDTTEDRAMVAEPDPLLDEPEWGGRKSQPDIKKKKEPVQTILECDE
jgi:hypothetical protein